MNTYSFRAECQEDVDLLRQACLNAGLITSIHAIPDHLFPDVEVELQTEASLALVQSVMREVPDGHVMLQTLRNAPLSVNRLDRNYDLH